MQNQSPAPLLDITVKVTPQIYESCSLMMAERMKKRRMPRAMVEGGVFVACALGFLAYMLLYVQQHRYTLFMILSGVLLVLGIYNLLHYPLWFLPRVQRRAQTLYDKSSYLHEPIRLRFFDEYIEETTSSSTSRVQWTAVQGTEQQPLYFLLRLSSSSGIIIPRDQLEPEQELTLTALLQRPARA